MNIFLWVIQGLLAAMFLMAGAMKLIKPKEELKLKIGDWVDDFSSESFKLIGLVELMGAVGIVLPMGLGILPILTPLAATGLALTMASAMVLHLRRKEQEDAIKKNVPLLLLALFVAVGRFFLVPVI